MTERPPPTPITRAGRGRWLGGVCAGFAASRGRGSERPVSPVWLRLGFLGLTALGGIGPVIYLACWLILPGPPEAGETRGARGVVVLAKLCAWVLGLLLLAGLAATATVFGFGWFVFAAAAAALVGALAVRRLGPAVALLPVAALTIPAVAVAAAGLRLTPTTGETVVRVPTSAVVDDHTYRSGLNTLLLDLRRTSLPAAGELTLHVDAGIRRTIVALPAGRCVHVVVHPDIDQFPARAASLLSGRDADAFSSVFLFGKLTTEPAAADLRTPGRGAGPTLIVDFDSMGGSLYVRDYPTSIDPDLVPDWPGYPEFVEPRPKTHGLTRRGARRELFHWRIRRLRELAAKARYAQLAPGPCGPR